MSVRFIQTVKYIGIQISLDLLFCVIAGFATILYGVVFLKENLEYVILIAVPSVYLMFVFVRYVTLLEFLPRMLAFYLICGEYKIKLWMAIVIGLVSYGWVIVSLQCLHKWDQGSWIFPFYNVEVMSIYTACMVISTLISPLVVNRLKDSKTRR